MDTAQVLTLLRDQIWSSIDAILAVLIFIVGYFIVRGRNRMALCYDAWMVPIVRLGAPFSSRMKIMMDDKLIDNLFYVSVTVTNTGRVPIRPSDYDGPIVVDYGESGAIVESRPLETSPSFLAEKIATTSKIHTGETDMWSVDGPLLNPGDSFTVNALLNQPSYPEIRARIAGVREVTECSPGDRVPWLFSLQLVVLSVIPLVLMVIVLSYIFIPVRSSYQVFLYGLLLGVLYMFVLGWIGQQRRIWRFKARYLP